ncbi:MAG: RcnB family protein [Sphingomonas sp.]|nr:RcnB family protein [Sphingomonas sp.]
MPSPPPAPMPAPHGGGQWNGGSHGGQWQGGQWHGGGQWNGGQWSGGQWSGGQWHGGTGYNGQWRRGGRWGGSIGGFWYAGVQAPGGWNGYKHLKRGRTLPGYWISDAFMIGDYGRYGLFTPPPGYYWTRYYNDAVLIDRYGVIYDSRDGLDWDSYDAGYQGDYAYGAGGDGYVVEGYQAGPGYPPPPAPVPAPGYGASYSYRAGAGYIAAPPPPMPVGGAGVSITTYPTPPGVATTIVIPGAVTTTTTTEYVEERYVAPRRAVRVVKRAWHPRPKPRCYCQIRGS